MNNFDFVTVVATTGLVAGVLTVGATNPVVQQKANEVASEIKASVSADIQELFGSVSSPGAIAIGAAEGTMTPDGTKTQHYEFHFDPGNGEPNTGMFSCQNAYCTENGRRLPPEEADKRQLSRIRKFAERLEATAQSKNLELGAVDIVAGADLFNQSELAGHDYLDRLKQCRSEGKTGTDAVLCARERAYIDPQTGRLDAPGLGNDPGRVRQDQKRRIDEILETLRK
ncbi:MAG: hypothetical protein LRZ84_14625 [Desertifilum sp.]|nr:hypothetical protein [Desertifilum sp.]